VAFVESQCELGTYRIHLQVGQNQVAAGEGLDAPGIFARDVSHAMPLIYLESLVSVAEPGYVTQKQKVRRHIVKVYQKPTEYHQRYQQWSGKP